MGVALVKQKALTCPFKTLSPFLTCFPCSISKNDLTFQELLLSLSIMVHMQIQQERYLSDPSLYRFRRLAALRS